MQKHILLIPIYAILLIGLSACQTTSRALVGVSPEEVRLAKMILVNECVITSTRKQSEGSRLAELDRVDVMSIRDRHEGWRAANVAYQGFRDNIYYHPKTGKFVCGGKNWSGDAKPESKELPSTALITPADKSNLDIRAITVTWEGYKDNFAGTIREIGDGSTGAVAIVLPNNEGECAGDYAATSRTEGKWNVRCSNGMTAQGTFRSLGAGKGSIGKGVDKDSRAVTYTISGRT